MKRRTQEPWFGKKRVGYGLRPITWQGWLASLIFVVFILGTSLIIYLNPQYVLEVDTGALALVLVFLIIMLVTSDESIHRR
jgi:hypothetical protein